MMSEMLSFVVNAVPVTASRVNEIARIRTSCPSTSAHSDVIGKHSCRFSGSETARFSTGNSRQNFVAPDPSFVAPRPFVPAVVCSSATELPTKFNVAGRVSVEKGEGGLPKVVLTHESGSKAEVYLLGACVTSWKKDFVEYLLVSDTATWDGTKPIRGGIPICWPQFGPGPLPQHGFARNETFAIASSGVDKEGTVSVVLELTDNAATRALWDFPFRLTYTLLLTKGDLRMELKATNTAEKAFSFAAALHTYFQVLDVKQAQVRGLKGLTLLNKLTGAEETEAADPKAISGPVDSVYYKSPAELRILDRAAKRGIVLRKYNFSDAVVWNPWDSWASAEWGKFVCLEAAQVGSPVTLAPGKSWEAWQVLSTYAIA